MLNTFCNLIDIKMDVQTQRVSQSRHWTQVVYSGWPSSVKPSYSYQYVQLVLYDDEDDVNYGDDDNDCNNGDDDDANNGEKIYDEYVYKALCGNSWVVIEIVILNQGLI